MGQKYKIFYRRHYFVFDQNLEDITAHIVLNELNKDLLVTLLQYLKESTTPHVIQITQKKGFEAFIDCFRLIYAAGGAVFNTQGKLLLMKRKGVWDLPKGKLDKGEEIVDAAVREVEEECSVFAIKVKNKITITYHIYFDKKWLLKETHWFKMKTKDWQKAKPQVEEDIEKIKWVNFDDVDLDDLNTYQNIKQVLRLL